MRRLGVAAAWATSVAAAAAATWVCCQWTLQPEPVSVASDRPVTVRVREGAVGWSMDVPVLATWASSELGVVGQSGTVTSVLVATGQQVSEGDVLMSIDMVPVTVAQGEVPAFRDMARGMEGQDITQLQSFLGKQGVLKRPPNAKFDAATESAVKVWQKKTGHEQTGTVARGELYFVPSLPVTILLPDEVRVGRAIAADDVVARAVSTAPELAISLNDSQLGVIPLDQPVSVKHAAHTWTAHVVATRQNPDTGEVTAVLESPNGGPVCAETCAEIPVAADGSPTVLTASIDIVPHTSGPTVPQAAIVTNPSGETSVVTASGDRVPVSVVAKADGQVVIEGVAIGQEVRLFGDQSAAHST